MHLSQSRRKKKPLNKKCAIKKSTRAKPLILSLFCGAGGLDCGFEKQGFDIGLAYDIRNESIQSYNHNRKNKSGHVFDIRNLTIKELDAKFGSEFKPVGIIGGPPCQGFSVANVNKKKRDARNQLSYAYANLLGKLNKRSPIHFFVFENVKGLLGSKHIKTYTKIRKTFEKNGFNIFCATLNAVDFKVPQTRERLIIVGLNKKLYPNDTWQPPKGVGTSITVQTAIGKLPAATVFSRSLKSTDIAHHPNHWCMAPKSRKFAKKMLKQGTSFGRSFKTLDWKKPSPTVAYGNREVHVHPNGKRRLSIYEAMLLQGFPRRYVLLGNLSQQITQVSEAVPPPLAEKIAASIRNWL